MFTDQEVERNRGGEAERMRLLRKEVREREKEIKGRKMRGEHPREREKEKEEEAERGLRGKRR